jgi:uncharacterized protein YggE
MASVKVRGRGNVPARPDEAILTLEVVAVADSAVEAFSDASERAAALDGVLDEASVAAEARSTVGTTLDEFDEYEDGRVVRHRHRAAHAVSVRLTETDAIMRLLRAAVERSGTHVRGPFWHVRESSAAEAEACRRAVADSRQRAEAYAQGLGLRVGPVVAVEDAPEHLHLVSGPVRAAAVRDPAVYPAELTVSAAVDVTYELVTT